MEATIYGFDGKTAWREVQGRKRKRETGELFEPSDAEDDDFMRAKFNDGSEAEIMDLTVGAWKKHRVVDEVLQKRAADKVMAKEADQQVTQSVAKRGMQEEEWEVDEKSISINIEPRSDDKDVEVHERDRVRNCRTTRCGAKLPDTISLIKFPKFFLFCFCPC